MLRQAQSKMAPLGSYIIRTLYYLKVIYLEALDLIQVLAFPLDKSNNAIIYIMYMTVVYNRLGFFYVISNP